MDAKTLNCPMCGAADRSDASSCAHCGARLATVSCPSCFGLMFVGHKFCPDCGAAAQRAPLIADLERPCPRCKKNLGLVDLSGTQVCECVHCDGLWVDNQTFQQVCEAREKQSQWMGFPAVVRGAAPGTIDPVVYLKCPECGEWMNRVNFASCSGVIVDVCRAHGTWFDRSELRRVIEFIRSGGMEKARAREAAQLREEERRINSRRMESAPMAVPEMAWTGSRTTNELDLIFALGRGLFEIFKRR